MHQGCLLILTSCLNPLSPPPSPLSQLPNLTCSFVLGGCIPHFNNFLPVLLPLCGFFLVMRFNLQNVLRASPVRKFASTSMKCSLHSLLLFLCCPELHPLIAFLWNSGISVKCVYQLVNQWYIIGFELTFIFDMMENCGTIQILWEEHMVYLPLGGKKTQNRAKESSSCPIPI